MFCEETGEVLNVSWHTAVLTRNGWSEMFVFLQYNVPPSGARNLLFIPIIGILLVRWLMEKKKKDIVSPVIVFKLLLLGTSECI